MIDVDAVKELPTPLLKQTIRSCRTALGYTDTFLRACAIIEKQRLLKSIPAPLECSRQESLRTLPDHMQVLYWLEGEAERRGIKLARWSTRNRLSSYLGLTSQGSRSARSDAKFLRSIGVRR